jgi:hypothetical protein
MAILSFFTTVLQLYNGTTKSRLYDGTTKSQLYDGTTEGSFGFRSGFNAPLPCIDCRSIGAEFFLESSKFLRAVSIYRKVTSRSICYYSENQVFEGATNRDMSLNKTCFYSKIQKIWISKVFFAWIKNLLCMDFRILLCLDFKSFFAWILASFFGF